MGGSCRGGELRSLCQAFRHFRCGANQMLIVECHVFLAALFFSMELTNVSFLIENEFCKVMCCFSTHLEVLL